MPTDLPIPAAQYLRMSTEHQQYSLVNQAIVIERYADNNGFAIVRTYSDAAKSGLVLKHRTGLRQLLHDVVDGNAAFRTILVYDVSRWGRFQDTDEAAHYEFLCKSAGVPIHYCAEPFDNDGTVWSLIVKALKRTMAAEYSRELSVKVSTGQRRLASLGFWQGAFPGYGMRRMLVSSDRVPKQLLKYGEHKSISTDRVILVPGPPEELRVVRQIYQMLITEGRGVNWIARELNRNHVPFVGAAGWDYKAVQKILTHPKYVGCHVFGRTTQKLCTPRVPSPKPEWTVTPSAFERIVDQATFDRAQEILQKRSQRKSNQELIDGLRSLLAAEGKLTLALIQQSPIVPSGTMYRKRFGGLRRAYELVGYDSRFIDRGTTRRRTAALRKELIAEILARFPDLVTIVPQHGRRRTQLRLQSGCRVEVVISRSVRPWKKTVRWLVHLVPHGSQVVTLLARLNPENTAFQDFHVIPSVHRFKCFYIRLYDKWLTTGERLGDLSDFCSVVDAVSARETRQE